MTPAAFDQLWRSPFDTPQYLAQRRALLGKLVHDHLRWEHQLALSGKDALLVHWVDMTGETRQMVFNVSFLDLHHAMIAALCADLAAYGTLRRAMAATTWMRELQAFTVAPDDPSLGDAFDE